MTIVKENRLNIVAFKNDNLYVSPPVGMKIKRFLLEIEKFIEDFEDWPNMKFKHLMRATLRAQYMVGESAYLMLHMLDNAPIPDLKDEADDEDGEILQPYQASFDELSYFNTAVSALLQKKPPMQVFIFELLYALKCSRNEESFESMEHALQESLIEIEQARGQHPFLPG